MRLLATAGWSVFGEVLSKGCLFLSLVIVARILGAERYGQFGVVRTTVNMFAAIGGMGLGLTANRFVAQYRDVDKHRAGEIIGSSYLFSLAFGFVTASLLYALSDVVASEVLRAPQMGTSLRVAAALLFLGAVNGAQIGALQGLEAYRTLALAGGIQGLAALLFFPLGAHFLGVDGALLGFVGYMLVGVPVFHALINKHASRQSIRIRGSGLVGALALLWRFSVPAALMGIAIAPFKWLAEAVLARDHGFGNLGVFHASLTVTSILVAVVSTLNAPLISLAANSSEMRQSRRLQYVQLYGSWFFFLPLALPWALFPQLMLRPFGEAFNTTQSRAVVLSLLLYTGLMLYYQGVVRLFTVHGRMWAGLVTNLCEGAALIGCFLLLREWGVLGLGLAYVGSYLVRILATVSLLTKLAPSQLVFDRWFLLSLGMFVVVVWAQIMRVS
jgi:O-antigen/teichoic acid export membrane protein